MNNIRKRILLIGPYPPPYGGIASHIVNLVPSLINEVFEVFILSRSDKDEVVKGEGFTIINLDLKKEIISLLNPFNIHKNLSSFIMLRRFKLDFRTAIIETLRANIISKLVMQNKIQLVSFYSMLNAYSVPILGEIFGIRIPIVLTIYGAIYENPDFFRLRSKLVESILDHSNKALSSSKYCAKSVELLGIESSKIEPLYYGVDLVNFSPNVNRENIRRDLNIRNEDNVLLFVGRLNEEMGLDSVLKIIPNVLSQRRDVVFLIVGAKGTLEREAMRLQGKYKNRVYVGVDAPFDDLPYYYAACDLVLAPTRDMHACMGMAIKEAMASGKPVIASATGGIPEAVIDKETGVLLPTRSDLKIDEEVFCKAILEFLDSPLLKQIGINARRRAEELFDSALTSGRTIDIFEKLLEEKDE